MKAKLCLAVGILALAWPAAASAEVNGPDSPVSQAATAFRGTPIDVHCTETSDEWLAYTGPFGIAYTAFVPWGAPSSIYLSPRICVELLDATTGNRAVTRSRAVALQTLLHEMMHTAGVVDEHAAEELSYYLFRWYVQTFWSYSPCESLALYGLSWARHLERGAGYSIPARYAPRGHCKPVEL